MKKVIASLLILTLLLQLFQPIARAETKTSEGKNKTEYNSYFENGEASVENDGKKQSSSLTYAPSGGGTVANVIAIIVDFVCVSIISTISAAVRTMNGDSTYIFTIYDAVFNNIDVFDANILLTENNNSIRGTIITQVQTWYINTRNIAIILSLVMLIYIGIRMALSTIANDRARYKKMLIAWVQSFVLIFFMHYLIIISMAISQEMINILRQVANSGNFSTFGSGGEINIITNAFTSAAKKSGWDMVGQTILLIVLVYYQIKFFILYAKRLLAVAFLVIISPLITVTYSADKAGDGRAQAFGAWAREFEVNMFVQPLHALLYLIFIVSAGAIASKFPLLYVIFFLGLSRGEKVIKGLFNARGMKSIGSIGKGKKKK